MTCNWCKKYCVRIVYKSFHYTEVGDLFTNIHIGKHTCDLYRVFYRISGKNTRNTRKRPQTHALSKFYLIRVISIFLGTLVRLKYVYLENTYCLLFERALDALIFDVVTISRVRVRFVHYLPHDRKSEPEFDEIILTNTPVWNYRRVLRVNPALLTWI